MAQQYVTLIAPAPPADSPLGYAGALVATVVGDYTGKTGQTEAQIVAWMDAETWFTADEAIANGFCDRIAG